jgi:hypothetical protein
MADVTFFKYHDGCDGDYQYRQVTTTVCSKNITLLFTIFYSEIIILGMLWVRTEDFDN